MEKIAQGCCFLPPSLFWELKLFVGRCRHWFLLLVAAVFFIAGCSSEAERSDFLLGTICTLRITGGDDVDLDAAFARIRAIEARMSRHRPGSEVRKVGIAKNAGMQLSAETCLVLGKALEFGELSGGLFDITIAPVAELWGFDTEHAAVPTAAAIEALLPRVDYRSVQLDENCHVRTAPRQRLDLGAIAKGYAADEAARILRQRKVTRGLVNLGGNVLVFGHKKDNTPWKIGIQDPLKTARTPMGTLEIKEGAIVTSGIYERFIEENGMRYHHILNPATGYPEENNLAGVSVMTSSALMADALSTSLFLLGIDKGCALLDQFPGSGAVFITKDKKITTCGAASQVFTCLNESYTVVERR
ncbi:MAG: thiamine biosynthesis protein ApbE [Acidobacteria bacterium]|nr:MAG: thiamine biosynthesis protein ApbE [Acidobacteriota bacterium]